MKYQLPSLAYSYDALEPYIDAKTMEIHHSKHHQAYVDNLNRVLEKYPVLQSKDLRDLIRNLPKLKMGKEDKITFKNNGGGHLNHSLFWEIMEPKGRRKEEPEGELREMIEKTFGSFANFKELFSKTAISHFGSGWGWLSLNKKKDLVVHSTANQDSPILTELIPLMGVDVWEHAYYLKYQNRRAEYIENWWNVVNWEKVEENYKKIRS